jgi:hypothetical protein
MQRFYIHTMTFFKGAVRKTTAFFILERNDGAGM